MERLLRNPHFANSRRFPSFLRYVVQETLAGNTDRLKERTLGIEIFGKTATYDTATEPIVRVTAAEIRKRIAQYYQDPGHEQEMRFLLPSGSYIPQFEFPDSANHPPEIAALPPIIPPEVLSRHAAEPPRRRGRMFAVAALLGVGLLLAGWIAHQKRETAFARFWQPILGSADPVLFCVADQTHYTTLRLRSAADPTHQVELQDSLTAVIIDDLNIITRIAGVLQTAGMHYTVRGENATTLSDLRSGPTVIVGAFDNAWTLRLLAPTRFHFANDADMSTFSIVDAKTPGRAWTIERHQQLATNNYKDYAVVARFTDPTTGKPTLIAAGIGRGGTIAAGDFLTSSDLLAKAQAAKPSGAENIEVVLSTEIIDGQPGIPTIEAVHYW